MSTFKSATNLVIDIIIIIILVVIFVSVIIAIAQTGGMLKKISSKLAKFLSVPPASPEVVQCTFITMKKLPARLTTVWHPHINQPRCKGTYSHCRCILCCISRWSISWALKVQLWLISHPQEWSHHENTFVMRWEEGQRQWGPGTQEPGPVLLCLLCEAAGSPTFRREGVWPCIAHVHEDCGDRPSSLQCTSFISQYLVGKEIYKMIETGEMGSWTDLDLITKCQEMFINSLSTEQYVGLYYISQMEENRILSSGEKIDDEKNRMLMELYIQSASLGFTLSYFKLSLK